MPPKTGAKIRLGGKQHTLRYTARALMRAEEELDVAGLQEIGVALGDLSVRHLVVMLWAGLLHADPDLSLDEVADLTEPPLVKYIRSVMKALKPWFKVPDEATESEPKKKAAPAG